MFDIIITVIATVLLTSLIVWAIINIYFKNLKDTVLQIVTDDRKREDDLKSREKLVIAAAIEGELSANQAKLQAFLTVYQEMLRNLKEPTRAPKYKQPGEIIHEKPALSRTIFEAYADKLMLLGDNMTRELARIYTEIETDPPYKTLSDNLSTDQTIHIVERIVENAQNMNAPMEKAIGALGVIVRNRQV